MKEDAPPVKYFGITQSASVTKWLQNVADREACKLIAQQESEKTDLAKDLKDFFADVLDGGKSDEEGEDEGQEGEDDEQQDEDEDTKGV